MDDVGQLKWNCTPIQHTKYTNTEIDIKIENVLKKSSTKKSGKINFFRIHIRIQSET